MATIETYGDRTIRLRPKDAPLRDPGMASPDAFGAPIAEGVRRGVLDSAQALAIANQRNEREAQEARTARLMARANELSAAEDEILYGENGAMAAEGEAAAKATDDYDDRFTKKAREIAETLEDPRDREEFNGMAERRRAGTRSRVMSRARTVTDRYKVDTMDASIVRDRTDALRVFQDAFDNGSPEEIARATARLSASVDTQVATRRHLELNLRKSSKEAADLLVQKDASDTYSGAIDALVARGKFKEARTYFEQVKPQILPGQRDAYAKDLAAGATNQEAQDITDGLFKSGYAVTKADADRMVSQLADADLRDRVQTKVDREWARREAHIEEARTAAVEELALGIEAGGDPDELITKHADKAALKASDIEAIHSLAGRVASRQEPKPSGERWQELINEAHGDPAAFMKRNLRLELGKITRQEYEEFARHKAAMIAGKLKNDDTDPIPAGVFTAEEIGKNALREFGIDPSIKDGQFVDKRALSFLRVYSQAIQARGGSKKLTEKDQEKIAADLLVKHRLAGRGFFGQEIFKEVPRFEVPGMADRAVFSTRDIPPDYRARVRKDLMEKAKLSESEITPQLELDAYHSLVAGELMKKKQTEDKAKAPPADAFQFAGSPTY